MVVSVINIVKLRTLTSYMMMMKESLRTKSINFTEN